MLIQPSFAPDLLSHANWECYAEIFFFGGGGGVVVVFLTIVYLSVTYGLFRNRLSTHIVLMLKAQSQRIILSPSGSSMFPLLFIYFSPSRMMIWVSALWFSFL